MTNGKSLLHATQMDMDVMRHLYRVMDAKLHMNLLFSSFVVSITTCSFPAVIILLDVSGMVMI